MISVYWIDEPDHPLIRSHRQPTVAVGGDTRLVEPPERWKSEHGWHRSGDGVAISRRGNAYGSRTRRSIAATPAVMVVELKKRFTISTSAHRFGVFSTKRLCVVCQEAVQLRAPPCSGIAIASTKSPRLKNGLKHGTIHAADTCPLKIRISCPHCLDTVSIPKALRGFSPRWRYVWMSLVSILTRPEPLLRNAQSHVCARPPILSNAASDSATVSSRIRLNSTMISIF